MAFPSSSHSIFYGFTWLQVNYSYIKPPKYIGSLKRCQRSLTVNLISNTHNGGITSFCNWPTHYLLKSNWMIKELTLAGRISCFVFICLHTHKSVLSWALNYVCFCPTWILNLRKRIYILFSATFVSCKTIVFIVVKSMLEGQSPKV
jgi:hypothetical protein